MAKSTKILRLCATLTLPALLVSACAIQTLEKALPQLEGKKIDYAINYLGYPDQELDVADKKVYIWSHDSTGSTTTSLSKPVYTYNPNPYGGSYATYSSTTETITTPVHYQCKIKVVTNTKGKIVDTEFEGNNGGCNGYAKKLKPLVENQ